MTLPRFSSREQVFQFLDGYTEELKRDLDQRRVGKGRGLVKSYLIETSGVARSETADVKDALGGTEWTALPIGRGEIYQIKDKRGNESFIERLSSRHLAIHTAQTSKIADAAVQRSVLSTSSLDFAWFSGGFFQTIWRSLIEPQMPDRFIAMKFEHFQRFDVNSWSGSLDDDDDGESLPRNRSSVSAISDLSRTISSILPNLQATYAPFFAIKMLHMPAEVSKGGLDLWSWGKVTYRSESFLEGRGRMMAIAEAYESTVNFIEDNLWLSSERTTLGDKSESVRIVGAPVTISFRTPLSAAVFEKLIQVTFIDGKGPLRLAGKPIAVSNERVHVYGIDLHLWQRIYLEITPKSIVAVLPRGTCGNTVHRLVANIQRYVSADIGVYVADVPYHRIVQDALYDRLPARLEG